MWLAMPWYETLLNVTYVLEGTYVAFKKLKLLYSGVQFSTYLNQLDTSVALLMPMDLLLRYSRVSGKSGACVFLESRTYRMCLLGKSK